jgi:Nucleotidyl transferase AbiEii toxin, Type IV TA system/Domain of unknown function (DUF4365)
MREGASYSGVRVRLPATLGVARLVVALDLSFGDPGDVEEIRYPELLGGSGIPLRAYPIERTLAETIATMMERRELNTRDRDFADVWVLSRLHAIDGGRLRSALRAVAEHRQHPVEPLARALADMPDRQQSYNALRGRASFALAPPERWADLVADVVAFEWRSGLGGGAASSDCPALLPRTKSFATGYDPRMAQDSDAELAALITELSGLDPNSEHPAPPLALATKAVALAETLHSDEVSTARLLKARWLRIAAFRGLCHPTVAIPEIRYQLAAAEAAESVRDAVALERACLLVLDGETEVAAESICALLQGSTNVVVTQAGTLAATIVLERHQELSDELVARLRSAFLDSRRWVQSARDGLYFEVCRYTMDVALGLEADQGELRKCLISFCNTESDPSTQVYVSLIQLSEVLWPRSLWSQALELQLAVASSQAPGALRSAALTMAFQTSAQKSSLADYKTVSALASSLRQDIQATLPEEARDPDTLHILLAQSQAAAHLAGSVDADERTEAEMTASDSMSQLADANESARWPAIAEDMKETFDKEAEKLVARHRHLLAEVTMRSLEELSLSGMTRPAPPRHHDSRVAKDFDDTGLLAAVPNHLTTPGEVKGVVASPQTSRPRQIGVLAENIFSSACAALGWVVSKTPQESDYGVDFRVEPVFDRQIPGIEFFAQVKGTSQDIPHAPVVAIRATTASYWRAKLVRVAVVLVDIRDSTIRYGWFDGTQGAGPEGVTIRLGERFPGFLTEILQNYYESIRTDAVSSPALDSMLEAAATLSYALADDVITEHYPHLADQAAAQHRNSKFTVGQIQRQLRLMLMSQAVSMLRRPSPKMPELLDGPIADIRREIISIVDQFTVSTVLDRTKKSGLKDDVPLGAGVILTEVYDHFRPYLAYLSTRLATQLAVARSNLIRDRMSQLGHQST